LERENGDGEPVHEQDNISTTDPDATCASKGKTVARLGYYDNYLVDNASCVVVGVQATAARLSQESAAARDMIEGYQERYRRLPQGASVILFDPIFQGRPRSGGWYDAGPRERCCQLSLLAHTGQAWRDYTVANVGTGTLSQHRGYGD
jgi:hypothetical protein